MKRFSRTLAALLVVACAPIVGCGPELDPSEDVPATLAAGAVTAALDMPYVATGQLTVTSAVRSGPSNTYAIQANYPSGVAGKVFQYESVYVLEKDNNWYYIEYATSAGRKRGYVESSKIMNLQLGTSEYLRDWGYSREQGLSGGYGKSYKVLADSIVYAGPSTATYVSIGKVFRNESTFDLEAPSADINNIYGTVDGWKFVQYRTSSGSKRGWIRVQ